MLEKEFCGQGKQPRISYRARTETALLRLTLHAIMAKSPQARAREEFCGRGKQPRVFYRARTETALLRLTLHITMAKSPRARAGEEFAVKESNHGYSTDYALQLHSSA